MRASLCALLLLAPAACADDTSGPEALSAAEAVQAAAFDAMIELEGWEGAAAHCVSIGEWQTRQDPSAGVLRTLQRDGRPEVLGNSACEVRLEGTFRRDNDQLAQSFHVDSVKVGNREAVAGGFFRNHALAGGGYECRVSRRSGRWTADECEMVWVF